MELQHKHVEHHPSKLRMRMELISRIPTITDKDDPEDYIASLQSNLRKAEVPEKDWKLALTTRLNDCYRQLVSDIEADDGSGCRTKPFHHEGKRF